MIEQKIYNVGMYVRLSKDDERSGESVSIENQKLLLQKYVTDKGWYVFKVYSDDGYSGTNFERPAFKEMMEDAKDGKINLILVKDLSRLGRNYIQVGQYTDYIFPAIGCRFIAVNDGVDTINNDNDIMPFRNLFNEFYSRDTSKKIKAVKKANAQHGNYIGCYAPYGYKKSAENKHKFLIDEEAAQIVRRIFELRCEGLGFRKIAHTLNEENITPPRDYYYSNKGKKNPCDISHLWADATVKSIIRNEAYIGNSVQMKTGTMSYKNKKIVSKPKEEWIRAENTHEPIIDLETWKTVQELDKKRYKPRGTGNGITNMFAGIIQCADCGAPMRFNQEVQTRKKDGRKVIYVSYLCGRYSSYGKTSCSTHTIYLNTLLTLLKKDIQKHVNKIVCNEQAVIAEIEQKLNENQTTKQSTLKITAKSLKIRLDDLEKLCQSLYEDRVLGKVPENLYISLIQKYEQERAEKQDQLNETQEKMSRIEQNKTGVTNWVELVKKYMSVDELDQNMISELIDKVEIGERTVIDGVTYRDIKVYYKFVGNID